MLLDSMTYDNLFAGDFDVVTDAITIDVSQTLKRGDILKKGANGNYARPTVAVVATDVVVVASEDVTTDAATTKKSVGYKTGIFNQNAMRFGGTSTVADNKDVLADKSIYLQAANPQ